MNQRRGGRWLCRRVGPGLLGASMLLMVPVGIAAEPAGEASAVPPPPSEGLPAEEDDWLEGDWLEDQPDPAERDSLEPVNRAIFGFNETAYRWFFDPISKAYSFAVPEVARRSVRSIFDNLNEPVILVNDLLQLAPGEAGVTGGRFLVNTTVGLLGLFDPATGFGLPGHRTDFGETLAVHSTPSGPYLVIPVLGPSTLRDAVGTLVDGLMRPDTWILSAGSQVLLSAGSGLATYDIERVRMDALRATSIDFYSALRGAYLLDRDAKVEERIRKVCETESE